MNTYGITSIEENNTNGYHIDNPLVFFVNGKKVSNKYIRNYAISIIVHYL